MAKATLKKPAAKKAEATKTKPVLKKPAKKTEDVTEMKFGVGSYVEFVGYSDENPDAIFQAGDILYVVGHEDGQYAAISADDVESYKEDPESVEGELLTDEEIKKAKKPGPGRPASEKAGKAVAVREPELVRPMVIVPSLKKLLKKNSNPIEVALEVYNDINEQFFNLGGLLSKIKYDRLFEGEGYDTKERGWPQFCLDKFGFKVRKAEYFITIYQVFSELEEFDITVLREIGWSKAAEIARYVTADNVDELVDIARNNNYLELIQALKTEYVDGNTTANGRVASRDTGRVKRTTFTFQLHEESAEAVTEFLEEAKTMIGAEDINEVFERIVSDWARDNLAPKTKSKAKKEKVLSKKKAPLKAAA